LKFSASPAQQVGKYLLSPFTAQAADGHFTASISIRSGSGQATHDRVFRFTSHFSSRHEATAYALAQALGFLRQPSPCGTPSFIH